MGKITDTFEVRGRKIRELRDDTPGSRPPLLYLHGASMENEHWLPFLDILAEKYDIHAPSHPGFLDSEGGDDINSILGYVEHYQDYIAAKGWSAIDIVGLSFGGWIAAELAAAQPALVSNLVLVDAVGIWIRDTPITDIFAFDRLAAPRRAREMMFADPESALAHAAVPGPGPDGKPIFPSDQELLKGLKAFATLAKVAWNPLLHNPHLEQRLPRITARTQVIWGAEDRIVPVAYGEKYARLIPGAGLRIIEDAGHLPPLEQPEHFAAAVIDFLG